jgi:hypothetical protein
LTLLISRVQELPFLQVTDASFDTLLTWAFAYRPAWAFTDFQGSLSKKR